MKQLLNFLVDDLPCALPLAAVQSVVRIMQILPLDNPRKGQAGTINLHGRIIPVFSLRNLLGYPERPPRLSDMLVIASAGEETVALWIDEIRGVQDQPAIPALGKDRARKATAIPGISITDSGITISDLVRFLAETPVVPGRGTDSTVSENLGMAEPPAPAADPARVTAVLQERAARMVAPEPPAETARLSEVLRFQLAYQEYAISMDYVREVILTGEITPVPGTPDFISGICAVRGRIISLVDLRALFRIPEKGLTDLNRVIVITDGKITFGILADTISGVGTIALNQLEKPLPGELPHGRKYLDGVLGRNLYVLDAGAILGDPDIIVDDS
ncbi:MAG: chemotaxis protein CheW [Methanomicrobiales archaeon]|nr:chemotaxis protein CheW [Methanomicrobiales archaeon]